MSKKKKKGAPKHHSFKHLKETQGKTEKKSVPTFKKEEDTHSSKEVRRELRKSILFISGFMIALTIIFYIVTKTNLLTPLLDAVGLKGVYGI